MAQKQSKASSNPKDSNAKTVNNQQDKARQIINGIIVGVVTIPIAIIAFSFESGIFNSGNNQKATRAPRLSVINSGATEGSDGAFAIDNSGWREMLITTSLDFESNKATTVTVDGVEAELCDKSDECDFKIDFDKIGGNRTGHPYSVVATNDKGEDKTILRIVQRESSTNTNSYSEEDTKKHVAHIVCQNYIKQYFYPSSVKIHSIAGVGRDYAYGESWIYGVDVTVKSSAGGEVLYKATCGVAKWQNLEAGPYDGATGSVISFKAEPY